MAIYHFSVKTISRSAGYSAVAAAAYRAGENLTDERTGEKHDYRKRKGVACKTLILPHGMAPMPRAQLWNRAEQAETRINSTVARECEMSIPHELSKKTQISLANEMAHYLSDKYSIAVDSAVHEPTAKNDDKNSHAHLLMTTRSITKDGEIGAKTRLLDTIKTGSVEIKEWRKKWADICNRELEKAKLLERIDHRSFKDQGIDKIPTVHVGHGKGAAKRAAINAEIKVTNAELAESPELAAINAELASLLKERAELIAAEIAEAAIAQAAQDVTQALDQADKTDPVPVLVDANQDVAGAALTPAEIEVLHQELARPAEPTMAELQAALTQAEADATKARLALPKAQRGHDITRAKDTLPDAIEAAQTAAKSLAKIEHELENVPWWRPFKKRALVEALEQEKLLKQRKHDDMQELKATVKAPDHDAVMSEFLAAKERAKQLKATLDAMPQTQAQEPELKQNTVTALLLGDAARAKAAADKIKNK